MLDYDDAKRQSVDRLGLEKTEEIMQDCELLGRKFDKTSLIIAMTVLMEPEAADNPIHTLKSTFLCGMTYYKLALIEYGVDPDVLREAELKFHDM